MQSTFRGFSSLLNGLYLRPEAGSARSQRSKHFIFCTHHWFDITNGNVDKADSSPLDVSTTTTAVEAAFALYRILLQRQE